MARVSKATKSSSDAPVVSTPVSVPVEKAVKVKKTKEVVAPSAPVESTTPSDAAATEPEGDSLEASILEQTAEFNAKIQQLSSVISSLKSEFKSLEKKWQRELKLAQKQGSKRKRKTGNRAPSGFVKPTRISDELATFLGKEKGTEMARTAVTRDINAYIRTNNLQDKENGRQINPDVKLSALLKLEKADVLTYFNLQRFMSPHFAKSVKAEAPAATA